MNRNNFVVDNANRVICEEGTLEITMHLFFSCELFQNFWPSLGIECDIGLDILDMIIQAMNKQNIICLKETSIARC